ncbi:uncharacterized protein G2W53_009408 [Senna tora]|uniref:Uncharacterized protein n=1 Tax=Senna tora TaxID=362788 RepID=A0A834WXV8_9FABA|nr:uncharacterized protein G2W53_009408 [Senna tora]
MGQSEADMKLTRPLERERSGQKRKAGRKEGRREAWNSGRFLGVGK